RPALAVVQGDEPVRELGMAHVLTAQTALDLGVGSQQRALALLELTDVSEADALGHLGAEEELEQELAAEAFGPGRLAQPGAQCFASPRRDGVDLAIGLAALGLVAAPDEAVGGEPAEDRIDLAEALAPEVRDAGIDSLLDVVAGPWSRAEHAQDGVAGSIAGRHIADRYITRPDESSGAPGLVFGDREELALLPERDEALAVERTGAVRVQGGQMIGGAVALVAGEAVFGELLVDLHHDPVARDLGDDRRGRHGGAAGVAVHQVLLRAGEPGERDEIGDDQVGRHLEL